MIYLRQSTASQEVLLGPFLDDTDGKTAETALTINNTDIKIWVRGGTTEASKNSGGATHIASGRYYAVLDATDTATVGELIINVHVAGALPVRLVCCVLEEAVFDSLFAASAPAYSAMGTGTVTTGASTTSIPTSACSPAGGVANQFAGRVLMFRADTTTAALRGVACVISASSNAATPTFTVAMASGGGLPATPANGDTFVIL